VPLIKFEIRYKNFKDIFFLAGDFLEVSPVEVAEGGEVLISHENLKVLLDYKKLGRIYII